MNKRFDVVVNCKTWDQTAPWGMTSSAEVIAQPTLEAARRLAAELATGHGHGCLIAIREDPRDIRPRNVVEQVRGTNEDQHCDCAERPIIRRMTEHGEPRDEIRSRILWAQGHGLLGDDECMELLEAAGEKA